MTSKSGKYLKYVKAWENHPMLKEWLSQMPGDYRSAYCKVCKKPLHPHKKDLLLHAKAKRHEKNLENYKMACASLVPLKDLQYKADKPYQFHLSNIKTEPKAREEEAKNVTISLGPESSEVFMNSSLCDPIEDNVKNDTASILISGEASVDTISPYFSWLNLPEFSGWLHCENESLSCKHCNKQLKPSKTELIKHASTQTHQRRCKKLGIDSPQFEETVSSNFPDSEADSYETNIDLRSDTITQPNKGMREAMFAAELGDDTFQDDPTVKALEEKVCEILDKEAGLILPSGTMANLIAVLTHCWSRDSEVIVGDQSFIHTWSLGGLARIGGIQTRALTNDPDGTISLDRLQADLKQRENWVTQTLICIENPHTRLGGRVLPIEYLDQLGTLCSSQQILLHMDGARLLNASIACGVPPAELVRHCHSSTFCLNKGLGCPIGSVLAGSQEFINRAKRLRTLLGGTMHQSGIFCAAALHAVQNIPPKLHWDHANARAIAECVRDCHSSAICVDLSHVQTNIVHLITDNIRVNSKSLCERLKTVKPREYENLNENIRINATPISSTVVRLVTHFDLSKLNVQSVMKKLKFIIEEYDNILNFNINS